MMKSLPAIYLRHGSPHASSVLPSTVSCDSDGPPSDGGIRELAAPSVHSPMITHRLVVSYTTFSPLPCRSKAVIFFCPHLLSPIASTFRSGVPYAARTFLLCLNDTSDRPWQCFRLQKYSFFFKRSTFAIQKVSIINYIQLKMVSTLKFVINLRFEVLIANAR